MKEIAKAFVSIVALGIGAGITITTVENGITNGAVIIVIVVMIALMVMMNVLWNERHRHGEWDDDEHEEDEHEDDWEDRHPREHARTRQRSAHEKPKRQAMDKTALLLSMMDEHEKQAFKEALRQQILQEQASHAHLMDSPPPSEEPISLQELLEQKRGQA